MQQRHPYLPRLAATLLWALVAGASFYNLANYPTIWWDEAIFSETAANLVQHGRYALTEQSPDQLADLDYRISVGPAVILPVALAYRLLGVGLTSGRLVAGAFLVLTFLGLWLAARRLWGSAVALGAVAFALLGTDVLHWGRSVLGDIPALGLFLLSLWSLLRGLQEDSPPFLFLGGLFLGLAFDAKEFYGLAFLPPLFVLGRIFWREPRRLLIQILVFGVGVSLPLLAYLALMVYILGSLYAAVAHFLHQKALLKHEFFTPLTIGRLYPESFLYLVRHPIVWLGCLGLLAWRKQGKFSPGAQLWVANFLLWSLFYLNSVYWHRFALPALFLAVAPAAQFLGLLTVRLTHVWERRPLWLSAGVVMAFLILGWSLPGPDFLRQIALRQTHPPTQLVDYLKAHAPSRVLIETPEYELVFLDDDHRIHLIPPYFFLEATPDRMVLLNPRDKPYDFNGVGADLLIVGTFGKSVFREVYHPTRISRNWHRVATVDNYDIYVRQGKERTLVLPTWSSSPEAKLAAPGRPRTASP